jgi:hypothetical protein
MQEHMQTMQENMKTMRSMGGLMMVGSTAVWQWAATKTMAGSDTMQHHAMMEKCMDMMQMMMEQTMQHDQITESMPVK